MKESSIQELSVKDINQLNHALSGGTIDVAYLHKLCEEMRRKEILKLYKYEKGKGKDKRWYWYEPDPTKLDNRRKRFRTKKEEMEQLIVEYHLKHNEEVKYSPTVSNIFDDYFEATKRDKSILISTLNRYKN